MWRLSMDNATIPALLKTVNIVPIHESGGRGTPKNYRPVAHTSHLIKVFEKVVRNHLVSYLHENDLLNPGQHGFRLGRSYLSQLISHFDSILKILEDNDNVDVLYLDFAKAFNKVDFSVTLRKLKQLGISGTLGRWLQAFLTGRTRTVIVNSAASRPYNAISSVPQGSVIGPLMFRHWTTAVSCPDRFIDSNVASSFISSFADDTRIGRRIKTMSDVKDIWMIYTNGLLKTTCHSTPIHLNIYAMGRTQHYRMTPTTHQILAVLLL